MKKLNICIRKVKHGEFKDSLDIVILDWFEDIYETQLGSFGNVGSKNSGYCHSAGNYSYFRDSTVNATEKEYTCILNAFKEFYGSYDIIVHNRITEKFAKQYARQERLMGGKNEAS